MTRTLPQSPFPVARAGGAPFPRREAALPRGTVP